MEPTVTEHSPTRARRLWRWIDANPQRAALALCCAGAVLLACYLATLPDAHGVLALPTQAKIVIAAVAYGCGLVAASVDLVRGRSIFGALGTLVAVAIATTLLGGLIYLVVLVVGRRL